MERQTKHRLLGIIVIIGLVIILLPLFQSNNDMPTEAVLVTAPPFPDQPVDITANSDPLPANPLEPTAAAVTTNQNVEVSHTDIAQAEMNMNKAIASDDPEITNSEPIKPSSYRIIEVSKTEAPVKKSEESNKSSSDVNMPALTVLKNPSQEILEKSFDRTTDEGLLKLKSSVWVVQIGSFKDKANALRVVNQLRARGYKAFIQQINTAMNDTTRVFIGPLHKRSNAYALVERLQNEMHIKGIVISYKPLTL